MSNIRRFSLEEIAAKSLKNCHAPGLDSVVLGEGSSGELVRVFWARKGHSLGVRHPYSDQLQIAFHGHHCAIDFTVIQGCMINCTVDEVGSHQMQHGKIKLWEFQSKIVSTASPGFAQLLDENGAQRCKYVGLQNEILVDEDMGRITSMNAEDIHTVFVPTEEAMWLLHEHPTKFGRNTKKVTYSNNDLSSFSFKDLYQPFTDLEEIKHVLDIASPWM
jgi:hypothetical protein